jgi:hypothetical protein
MIFDPFLFFCFFGLPLQNSFPFIFGSTFTQFIYSFPFIFGSTFTQFIYSFPFIFGSTFTQFILEFLWLNMVNRCRVSCVCPVLVFSYYYYYY